MVKEAIATGATTEEAYEKACVMLGVDPADAEFEVLETDREKALRPFRRQTGKGARVHPFHTGRRRSRVSAQRSFRHGSRRRKY